MTTNNKRRAAGNRAAPKHDHDTSIAQAQAQAHAVSQMNVASDWHRVGGSFAVQFRWEAGREVGVLRCVWSPYLPTARDQRRKIDIRRYEAARDSFAAGLAKRLGLEGDVLVGDRGGVSS